MYGTDVGAALNCSAVPLPSKKPLWRVISSLLLAPENGRLPVLRIMLVP